MAVDKVANASGCVVYGEDYGDDNIRVYNQDSINPHVAYAGPFRFLATNINSNDSIATFWHSAGAAACIATPT